MFRKDYIQRKIDELGKALARILEELKMRKAQEQAQEEVEAILTNLLQEVNIDLEEVLATPNEQLLQTLVQEKEYTNEHLKYLGDILYEYATYTNDSENRKASLQKCLTLYQHITATETGTIHFEMLQRVKRINDLMC